MEILPKRESSRRKAKENSSTRRIMQERLLEDDEEMPGLDLTDSDDDATWTPFKEKGDKSLTSKNCCQTRWSYSVWPDWAIFESSW